MKKVEVRKEIAEAMMAREWEIAQTMQEMVHRQVADSMKALHSKMNKQVYEMAERQGVSIWDICFNYVPQIDYEHEKLNNGSYNLRTIATIVPLKFHYPNMED